MLKEDKTKKREERHKITQEDFTPYEVVCSLCDKVDFNYSSTVLDTSCGTGNILLEVLNRKFNTTTTMEDVYTALDTTYGVELMEDNTEECRERLYSYTISRFKDINQEEVKGILNKNIINTDFMTL